MTKDKINQATEIYMTNSHIEETIRSIEEGGWRTGTCKLSIAEEILCDDLKDFRGVVGSGRRTRQDYEYMQGFLTYLINKNDYLEEEN